MSHTLPLPTEAIDAALKLMRDEGKTIMFGGSRCHTTYGYSAEEGWYRDEFDEGYEERHVADEQAVRRLLEQSPDEARELLYVAARAPVAQAMRAGDEAAALAALTRAEAQRPLRDNDRLLRAILSAEAKPLDEPTRAELRDLIEGLTFWHLYMDATGWEQTSSNGRDALRFLDRVLALLGEPAPDSAHIRASFLELAGDLEGALAFYERKLAAPPRYEGEPLYIKGSIERLKLKMTQR